MTPDPTDPTRSKGVLDRLRSGTGDDERYLMEREHLTEFLSFRLATEQYALRLHDIREILAQPMITPVPRSPMEVMGITSVRGSLVTVQDPRVRLHLPREPLTKRSRVLLVSVGGKEIHGLFVDEVLQVHRLAPSEIETTGQTLGASASLVVGIGRRGHTVLFLLDPAPLTSLVAPV